MSSRANLQTLIEVGRGAMATVYRAHDPLRQRSVAVKYLHSRDASHVRRLRREALAQSALDHPGICKVHEFGEDARGAYIVMQYVDGAPLDQALAECSLERRLAVLAEACDAVDHAHRHGLVHRDLKPDNILVEEDAHGALRPYVVDFGLVMGGDQSTLTAMGGILGTPAYMAPEQARGEAHVDRRADVFSLGAILYRLATGVAPFEGDSPSAVLARVLHEDPLRPRKRVPGLPSALERIILQALEKDPRHRYPDAAALARDVRRHLAGASVEARASGWTWRLYLSASRNPRLALAATLVLMLTAFVVAGSLWQQRNVRLAAEARAAAAQHLGAALGELEWQVRAAMLVPPHDLEPQHAEIRARARMLAAGVDLHGSGGAALTEYLLGRAELALGDEGSAVERLRRAIALGLDEPQVRLSLGLALSRLYFREHAALDRVADADARAVLQAQIDDDYRLPALAALQAAGDATTPYASALLLHLGGAMHADAVRESAPWDFDALLLRAEILAAGQDAAVVSGTGIALDTLLDAREAVLAAAAIAPSSPDVATGACRAAYQEAAALTAGVAFEPSSELAELCQRLTLLRPSDPRSYAEPAHMLVKVYEAAAARGEGDAAVLDQVVALATHALALPASDHATRWAAADALARAAWEMRADAVRAKALLLDADGELARVTAAQPGALAYRLTAGATSRKLAAVKQELGEDPAPSIAAAVSHLQAATASHPEHAFVWNNLGFAHKLAGNVARSAGGDPLPHYRAAIDALEQARVHGPGQATILNNLGNAWSDLGQWQLPRDDTALDSLDRAMALYAEALELDPGYLRPINNRANVARIVAHRMAQQGEDPEAWLQQGLGAVAAALAAKPDYALPCFNAASLEFAAAWYRYWSGSPVADAVGRSRRWFQQGLSISPLLMAELEYAKLDLLELRDRQERGEAVDSDLRLVRERIDALAARAPARRDLRLAQGEGALLTGTPDCRAADLDQAAAIVRELSVATPAPAQVQQLAAETALRRCRCAPDGCDLAELAQRGEALAALGDDAMPLRTLRLRYELARLTDPIEALGLLDALPAPLRQRVEALAAVSDTGRPR